MRLEHSTEQDGTHKHDQVERHIIFPREMWSPRKSKRKPNGELTLEHSTGHDRTEHTSMRVRKRRRDEIRALSGQNAAHKHETQNYVEIQN